ncbi:MAG: methyltransferase domain-containing protein [Lapillicoccus sp.]
MNSEDVRTQARAAARRLLVAGAARGQDVAVRHHWLPPSDVGTPPAAAVAVKSETVAPETVAPEPVAPPVPTDTGLPRWDFNTILHSLRGAELRRMPRPRHTMLSAGCSDRGYFDWLAQCIGPVERHIGIELYLPEPESLPPGVEWVKNSVGDMSSVAPGSVDLVFSGQNFEHLFHDDAVRFLVECHRVLEPGGHLVIDSPNRDAVERLGWTHPEHTVEFTPAEASELVELAGFDDIRVRGLWLCIDPATGGDLDLWPWPDGGVPPVEDVVMRSLGAAIDPEHSFVWWLEARRGERSPEVAALLSRHAEIHAKAWRARLQRVSHQAGELSTQEGTPVVSVPLGVPGWLMFGPYVPLAPGSYTVRFTVRRRAEPGSTAAPATTVCRVDVCNVAEVVFAERELTLADLPDGQWTEVELAFDLKSLAWGGQFRIVSTGAAALDARYVVDYDVIEPSQPQT